MSGLLALLDDVVALAKLAAASLDDAAGQAAQASAKAAGVVIDDTAVTPRYVTGARRPARIAHRRAHRPSARCATSCSTCCPPRCCSAPSCRRRSRRS
ncbi:MAG: DUF808 family protein [Hyphomicrobium sp.]